MISISRDAEKSVSAIALPSTVLERASNVIEEIQPCAIWYVALHRMVVTCPPPGNNAFLVQQTPSDAREMLSASLSHHCLAPDLSVSQSLPK